jgi:hypothetical protein
MVKIPIQRQKYNVRAMQEVSREIIKPNNLPEVLVWYSVVYTYPAYVLGVQLTWVTLLATALVGCLFQQWWNQTAETPLSERIKISPSAWAWVIAVILIEVALIVGHLNYDYDFVQIIRSSFRNWYRSWALFALFILAGHLNIRAKIIYRAICILCLQCLVMVAIGLIGRILNLPPLTYTIPIDFLCGSPERCTVELIPMISHPLNISFDDQDRLKLFAVWPTYLALLGNLYFFLALQDRDRKWRGIGVLASIVMIVASFARAATLCLPAILISVWFLTNIIRPWIQILTGAFCFLSGVFSASLIDSVKVISQMFHNSRAGSSKVRFWIYEMSLARWRNEALIWGRGIGGERGPALINHLPLGSHQTWVGILFAHGLVGGLALALAFAWSFFDLLIKAQFSEIGKLGLSILLILLMGSFVDNIDFFAYLFWPGLVVLGIAFREQKQSCTIYPLGYEIFKPIYFN